MTEASDAVTAVVEAAAVAALVTAAVVVETATVAASVLAAPVVDKAFVELTAALVVEREA